MIPIANVWKLPCSIMAQLKPSNSNSLIFNGNLVVCHIEWEIAQSLGLKE